MGKYFIKEGSYRFFKSLAEAGKEALIGTEKTKLIPGIMMEERTKAKQVFDQVKDIVNPFRARIKSPESIQNNLAIPGKDIGDLLGMQTYSKNPYKDVKKYEELFEQNGGGPARVKRMNKPGYVGANISGNINGVATELQISPGLRANFGQILQHNSYKMPDGYTKWDKDHADMVGKWFIDKGIENKPVWKQFLGIT
jgi:hypothetical protein